MGLLVGVVLFPSLIVLYGADFLKDMFYGAGVHSSPDGPWVTLGYSVGMASSSDMPHWQPMVAPIIPVMFLSSLPCCNGGVHALTWC